MCARTSASQAWLSTSLSLAAPIGAAIGAGKQPRLATKGKAAMARSAALLVKQTLRVVAAAA